MAEEPAACKPAPAREVEAPRCPVCGEGFTRETVVLCQACSSPHHQACFRYNKGCATYACSCRTAIPPPLSRDDEIDFSDRGMPNLTAVLLLVPLLLFGILGAHAVWGKAAADMVGMILAPFFVCGILGSTVLPLLTERRYRLSPATRSIQRQVLVGGARVLNDERWREIGDVEGLRVETGWFLGHQSQERRRTLAVFLELSDGERIRLEQVPWTDREPLLWKLEGVAHALDTVVDLPRELTGTKALPPGVSQLMESLPQSEEEETPALPAAD